MIVASGLDRANLARLSAPGWGPDRWPDLFAVSVPSGKARPLPIAGSYRVAGDTVRFEPRFPFEPGLRHLATFDPSMLPVPAEGGPVRFEFEPADAPRPARAFVVRMEPEGDVLPANLLKIYLHFSAPMSRGEVYDRVRLTDASGRKVDGAFLEIGEELWDRSGTRVTLLLDPGRIKRGLRPHEEEGPIFVEGRPYALVVDRDWPDAEGRPMLEPYRRAFRAGPAVRAQPDPANWTIEAPEASSREPLTVKFPGPLDRAILDRALVLLGPDGKAVAGRATVGARATRWDFRPDRDWAPGSYALEIDPALEDLAGNSVARPFEVDVERPVGAPEAARRVRLMVTIPAARRP